ncbi:MAG: hypothetical protein Q4A16_08010 [Lautropia sp.]|nr:hypothetical protein [Lautropia sp.]
MNMYPPSAKPAHDPGTPAAGQPTTGNDDGAASKGTKRPRRPRETRRAQARRNVAPPPGEPAGSVDSPTLHAADAVAPAPDSDAAQDEPAAGFPGPISAATITGMAGAEPTPVVAAVLAAALGGQSTGHDENGAPAVGASPLPMTRRAPASQIAATTGHADRKPKKAKRGEAAHKDRPSHIDVPERPGDFISPWNKARIKCIRNPNPALDTHQAHVMELPELCPASHNPLPGSTLVIHYRGKARFLEVFSLSAYIQAAIGHPIVRDVEALTQAVALDCAHALQQKVHVEGRFLLRGLAQTVITKVSAKPLHRGPDDDGRKRKDRKRKK